MPMIMFRCNNPDCDNNITKMFNGNSLKNVPAFLDCGQCGTGILERQLGAPSSHKTQIIDNGLQARSTEVMDVIVEKETDRAEKGEK